MTVTVSIVSYNTKDLIKRCIASIFKKTKGITIEVIVVDNASSDGTVEEIEKSFPQVTVIKNKKNAFFARANNQTLKKAKGNFFLVLNADTYFTDNSIKTMVDYLKKNRKVGAVEGLEVDQFGKDVPTGSKFSTPLIDFYELSLIGKRLKKYFLKEDFRYSGISRKETFSVDVGCDAFLMLRTDLMKKIKGYDNVFDLFYTENDVCLRIKKLGYEVIHLGSAKVVHHVSSSISKIGWRKMDIYYRDLYQYYKKHFSLLSALVLFSLLKGEQYLLMTREKIHISLKK